MSKEAESGPTASKFSAEALNSAVQTLAIVLAGVWAVYTFIYEAKIAPGLAPPSVSVTTKLERVGEKDGMLAIRSTVTRTNVGQTEVRVLGLTYNVVGVKVRFGKVPSAGAMAETLPKSNTVVQLRYYNEPEGGEVILRYGVLFEGATALPSEPSGLNPGEAVSRDLIFYADPAKFDSIQFLVELAYAKMSEPPVPLAFEVRPDGRIAAVSDPPCQAKPSRCRALVTTDFGTEFSLWQP
ncbi:hypothetical protein ACFQS7_28125 [Dankookia sp. GCM10030260]|uniref:hypothetical protein n=1 Tax=Dankookia sp. GCM10030260 TaxID=3273390 RepID=UPI00360E192E